MWHDYDFLTAEKEFERSIELNPRYAIAHHWFGVYLGLMGRYEEGYTELKRAIRLDPHAGVIHFGLGLVYLCSRRYDQAIEQLERALELDPSVAQAHVVLGVAYLCKSLNEPAIAAMQKGVQLSQGACVFIAGFGLAYATAGHEKEAQKILNQLQELSKQRYLTPYLVARITALDRKDKGLRWLETAYQERDVWMVFLKTDPRLDDLRADPRFEDLLRCMNFR